jgi:hypothetical protein
MPHYCGRSLGNGSARRLFRSYHYGQGAVHSKMLRCRPGELRLAYDRLRKL